MKAQQENWICFNEHTWYQNGRTETRHFGTAKWLVSDHGGVKREYYNHEDQLVKSIEVHQHWKGRSKKYLAIPTGEYVHRLVAKHFIPNPHNLKFVIFMDGDVTNIHVNNLQWFNTRPSRIGVPLGKRTRINTL